MLIKINETGLIFTQAIDFLKAKYRVKTSSKAVTEAILDYEMLVEMNNALEKKLFESQQALSDKTRQIEKIQESVKFLLSV